MTPKTKNEWLEIIEQMDDDLGLNSLPLSVLSSWCQAIGQSGRGDKQELVKRLRKAIA